jgi:hypothetical protein
MGDRLDELFAEWHSIGGAVLLRESGERPPERRPEELLAESTSYFRASGRLMWVALDWLVRHSDRIDPNMLLAETRRCGDLSVLGVLADAAYQSNRDPSLLFVTDGCVRHEPDEIFFHRVGRSDLASRLTREQPNEVFRRWGYLSNELRYLDASRETKTNSEAADFARVPGSG